MSQSIKLRYPVRTTQKRTNTKSKKFSQNSKKLFSNPSGFNTLTHSARFSSTAPTRKSQSKAEKLPAHTSQPYNVVNITTLPKLLKKQTSSLPTTAGTVLYISNVLPDPSATAAGLRTMGIFRSLFQMGFQPIFLTPSRVHMAHQSLIDKYTDMGIPVLKCEINEENGEYEGFIQKLAKGSFFSEQCELGFDLFSPNEIKSDLTGITFQEWQNGMNSDFNKHSNLLLSMVIYDRYTVEELFGMKTKMALESVKFDQNSNHDQNNNPIQENLNPSTTLNPAIPSQLQSPPKISKQSQNSIQTSCLSARPILSVIDTQDLHFLRFAREELINSFDTRISQTAQNDSNSIPSPLSHPIFSQDPCTIFSGLSSSYPNLQRELGPYLRSDLVLTVSQNEADLLQLLGIPKIKTLHVPITYEQISMGDSVTPDAQNGADFLNKSFEKRANSMFIGTMRHPPNVNCVEQLGTIYTPLIKQYNAVINEKQMGQEQIQFSQSKVNSNPNRTDIPAIEMDKEEGPGIEISKVQAQFFMLKNELDSILRKKGPQIDIYGTYMTKEQTNMTIPPSSDEILIEERIALIEHQLNIIGGYLSKFKDFNLNDPNDSTLPPLYIPNSLPPQQHNFYAQKGPLVMKGTAKHAIETISRYKTLLTPLSFGAGVKGKVIDSWIAGTPVIGTGITAEGLGVGYEINSDLHCNDEFSVRKDAKCCMLGKNGGKPISKSNIVKIEHNSIKCGLIRDEIDQYCLEKYGGDTKTRLNSHSLFNTPWPGVVHNDPHILSLSALLLNQCQCEWENQSKKIKPILHSFSDHNSISILTNTLLKLGAFRQLSAIDGHSIGNLVDIQRHSDVTNNTHRLDPKLSNYLVFKPSGVNELRQGDFLGQMMHHKNNNSQYYMTKYIQMKNRFEKMKKS
jgi:hypothetical protein